MNGRQSWRLRSIRTMVATLSASVLILSGAVFAVSASALNGATQLVIHTQPPSSATSGVALTTAPVVYIADGTGSPVTSLNSAVTATITGQGSTQLANATVNAVNGVATFTGLTLNTPVGTYTLTFTDTVDALTSVASTAITVVAGTATQLAITTQPTSGEVSGVALVTQPVVKVEDVNNNVVTSATGTVTASSSCSLSGTTAVSLVNGVATFTNLTLTGATNTSCTISFAYSGLGTVSSNAVLLSGPATQLVITTQPPSSAPSGAPLYPQPVVLIEDAQGTLVKSDTSTVTASVTTGTGSLTSPTAVAVAGTATFSGLALNQLAGTYYLRFTDSALSAPTSSAIQVTTGGPTKLAVLIQPSTTSASGAVLTQVPHVAVEDSGGNLVTTNSSTVTATITTGGVSITNPIATASSGLATFTGMALNALVGTYTITFSDGSLTPAVSTAVYVSTGEATKLVITTQPSANVASGIALAVQPVATIEDSGGNVVTNNYSTLSAAITASPYSLSHGTATAVAGTATFSGLALNAPVGVYTLTFSVPSLTSAVSNQVSVSSGGPTHLVITVQPPLTSASGVALSVVPVVKVEDVAGNVVTADSSNVTATITTGGVSVTNATQSAVNGVATFTGLALNARAGSYTLTFSDGALSVAISTSVTVYVGPATHLVVTIEPSAVAQSGVVLSVVPMISALDSGGNVVSALNTGYATASIASGIGGVVSAGASAPFLAGVATFTGLTITGTSGITYGLAYSGSGFSVVDAAHVTLGVAQAPLVVTSTHAIYGRNLRLATSGGSGTGAVSFVVINGTASGCRLSGAVLLYSSTGTCIVTALKAASGNFRPVSSSPTSVMIVKLAVPGAVGLVFKDNSSYLSPQARHDLILLARKLTSASRVRVYAYAPHNVALARARGLAVRSFLNARVHSHFEQAILTNTRLQSVRVLTISQ